MYVNPLEINKILVCFSQVIDSGSGYLCQMEPVAHFGLGTSTATGILVKWPDGKIVTKDFTTNDLRQLHRIEHPDTDMIRSAYKAANVTVFHTNSSNHNHTHTEL